MGLCLYDDCAEKFRRLDELERLAADIRRDLLLRAEPNWGGSKTKVVNLSAGYWDELNRLLGKTADAPGMRFGPAEAILDRLIADYEHWKNDEVGPDDIEIIVADAKALRGRE